MISIALHAKVRNAAVFLRGNYRPDLAHVVRPDTLVTDSCQEVEMLLARENGKGLHPPASFSPTRKNHDDWEWECGNSPTYSRLETSCPDLKERPRDVRWPCSVGRPVLREPSQSLFEAPDCDIGSGLQRAEFLPVIEDSRGDRRKRNALDLSIPARDAKQFVYG